MIRAANPLCVFLALLPLPAWGCTGRSPARVGRPNLVLVSVDCLRADHLSAYGYERETSPNLDRLASEGVRFERCLSTSSWTLPAHLSMLTGLPLSGHGIDDDRLWTRVDGKGRPLPVSMGGIFLPELLSKAGYRTAGFYTWKYLEPQFGFGPGFEVYQRLAHTFYSHPTVGPRFEALRKAGDTEGMKALAAEYPKLFDDTRPAAPEAVDRAITWLDSLAPREPFFLFLHLFDCHDPYTPPAPYDELFDPGYEGPIDGRRVTTADSPVRPEMAPADLAHLVALYDGEIRFVDSEIARLLEALERLGLTDQTLIAVTGDHGEEFYEHGRKTHRSQLFLESISVPLILRWPEGLPAGRVVAGNAGLVDILPTFCAAAGITPPPSMGRDLLPSARGEATEAPRPYLSELVLFDRGPVPQRLFSLVRGDEQRIYATRGRAPWQGRRLDLAADPLGRGAGTPVEDGDAVLARLRPALERLVGNLHHRQAGEPLTPEDIDELAALGYGGHGESIEGSGEEGRLVIDGGVWPDGE